MQLIFSSATPSKLNNVSLPLIPNIFATSSLPAFFLGQALGLLVPVSSMHYCASTSGLSTMSSTWSLTPKDERSYLRGVFTLRCLSAFIPSIHSYPAVPLAGQLVHQRYVHPGPLVLRTAPFKSLTPATDRDRTVSRRSEPSSRATLIGEQPNPWDRIQPQDVTSRHRGAKPPRRCGRLGEISLLSPG